MARLYSDLIDAASRRYYFGLTTAPGGLAPSAPATVTINGLAPVVQELSTVFRNPAQATLTLNGQSFLSGLILQPNVGAVSMNLLVPTEQRLQVITNALPPDYSTLPSNPPTILFINTITPAPAALTVLSLTFNLTQGGNIGFVAPLKGSLSMGGLAVGLPRDTGLGALIIAGLIPSMATTVTCIPDLGELLTTSLGPLLSVPFLWIDEDPPPVTTWLDESSP